MTNNFHKLNLKYFLGEGYCRDHSRAVVTASRRGGVKRRDAGDSTAQALQDSLSHYKMGRPDTESRLGQIVLSGDRLEQEEEILKVADTWAGDDGDSECESVDSEAEESLKHAGVYTGEEVMRTMRDKLIRLQKLYIEQFGRLGHLLRENRRTYLAQIRDEREAGLMSMYSQPGDTQTRTKLKALSHYHSPAGREALLAARLREKRVLARGGAGVSSGGSGHSANNVSQAPCQHQMTSTTKCGEGVVPMTKFCPKHILEQQGQVLFRACGAVTDNDDGPCQVPVTALFSHTHCVFHTKIQPRLTRTSVSRPEQEVTVNGADTDTDRDDADVDMKNDNDDSKTDSAVEDSVDAEGI